MSIFPEGAGAAARQARSGLAAFPGSVPESEAKQPVWSGELRQQATPFRTKHPLPYKGLQMIEIRSSGVWLGQMSDLHRHYSDYSALLYSFNPAL